MSKFQHQSVELGEVFQLTGAHDRQKQIELTLERLKQDRIKQAEVECQRIIADARNEAQQVIQAATEKAQTIIADGEAKRDDILQQGYQEGEAAGYKKGYAEGHQQAEAETVHLLNCAQTMVDGAYEAQLKVLKGFKPHAAQLVRHITQKVLNKELSDSPETLVDMLDEAVNTLHLTGRIRVLVSTDTLKNLSEYSATTHEAVNSLSRYELEGDPLLDQHEVFVLSEEGNFVISPEAQADSLLAPLDTHGSKNLDVPTPAPEELNAEITDLPLARSEQAEAVPESESDIEPEAGDEHPLSGETQEETQPEDEPPGGE